MRATLHIAIASVLAAAMSAMVAAASAKVTITDPPGDVGFAPVGDPLPGVSPQTDERLDVLQAWFANETAVSFDVGILTKSQSALASSDDVIVDPYNLFVQWRFGAVRYRVDFGQCSPEEALVLKQDVGDQPDTWGAVDCVPSLATAIGYQATVPKELILDAEGLPARIDSVFDEWFAQSHQLVGVGRGNQSDRGPDDGWGQPFLLAEGQGTFGDLTVFTPSPQRASNGGPDTMVFPVTIENRGDDQWAKVRATNLPPGWNAKSPDQVRLRHEDVLTFPVILTTGSAHDHGSIESFTLEIQPQTGPTAAIDLGIRYLSVPQLAGHHPNLFLHAEPSGLVEGVPLAWMNTLVDDAAASGAPLPASGSGSGSGEAHVDWIIPMDPKLLIGMDFDVGRDAVLETVVTTDFPISDARFAVRLLHCSPGSERGEPLNAECNQGSWFEVASGSQDSLDLPARSPMPVLVELAPSSYADLVPYVRGSNIALHIELAWSGTGAVTRPTLSTVESVLRLPLNEYRDPVDERFEDLETLSMSPLDAYEQAANPGQEVYFQFEVANQGKSEQSVRLDAVGHNTGWVSWSPRALTLRTGGSQTVVYTVKVPEDAVPGQFLEAFAIAENTEDPATMALAKFRVAVVEEAVEPKAPPPNANGTQQAPLPFLIPGGAVLWAASRRRK